MTYIDVISGVWSDVSEPADNAAIIKDKNVQNI